MQWQIKNNLAGMACATVEPNLNDCQAPKPSMDQLQTDMSNFTELFANEKKQRATGLLDATNDAGVIAEAGEVYQNVGQGCGWWGGVGVGAVGGWGVRSQVGLGGGRAG